MMTLSAMKELVKRHNELSESLQAIKDIQRSLRGDGGASSIKAMLGHAIGTKAVESVPQLLASRLEAYFWAGLTEMALQIEDEVKGIEAMK